MQPYNKEFARRELTSTKAPVVIGPSAYQAEVAPDQGWISERTGDGGKIVSEKRYPIVHVMGGKNVYYFLTSLDRGRLQVLPVAYDVHKKTWYDTAASGVRHFADVQDEALHWTDRMFTFNTTCFNCHVSELATNFDLDTDSYHTTWAEAGISCESCHGPGGEHLAAMERGEKGRTSAALHIIRTRDFTHEQMNDMCATCHAKLVPLSTNFRAGDKFFDHFDMIGMEHPDFYPDGRNLGENYTFSSWRMSPCVPSGKLDCNQCHTPSGQQKFEAKDTNQSCTPCHATIVANPTAHSHHAAASEGNTCIACHMPGTRFAAMMQTDHSMRPPSPAATLAFGSPNACNMCHKDKDPHWADQWVRKWYPRDYQAEIVRQGQLMEDARKNRWNRLPEILKAIGRQECPDIFRAGLIALLSGCDDPSKWPALIAATKDPSPLVRSRAVMLLDGNGTPEALAALFNAAGDTSRLVRIHAAKSLAFVPADFDAGEKQRAARKNATGEFFAAMKARPDDWSSYCNKGSFYLAAGDYTAAVAAFETAQRLEPRIVAAWVDCATAYSSMKRNDRAEAALLKALSIEPNNPAVNLNLGMLLAEVGKLDQSEAAFRRSWTIDPHMAAAAYNLAILSWQKHDLAETLLWSRRAYDLQPSNAKYAQIYAIALEKHGDKDEAKRVIERLPPER